MVQMYSVVLRKKINIPESKITYVTRNNRRFMVGTYDAKGKERTAWQIVGSAKK